MLKQTYRETANISQQHAVKHTVRVTNKVTAINEDTTRQSNQEESSKDGSASAHEERGCSFEKLFASLSP